MRTPGKVMGHSAGELEAGRCHTGMSSVVRNRYFYSMLLEWPDMAQDQAFHRGNVQRHNAEMHGFGTICGLRVEKTHCHEQVRIKKGVAVDCLGREIRVEADVLLELHDAVQQALERRRKRPKKDPEPAPHDRHHDDDDDDDDDRHCKDPVDVYVLLCYRELDERPVQAVGGPETCCKPACEMSRTRHGWCLEVALEPPHVPPRIQNIIEDLYQCEREKLGEWLCHWITEPCWQCAPDACGQDHKCVGLARVRVVPGGAVEAIDNCCVRPLVLPTVLIAALAEYAVTKTGREE